jgi:hypothetical protein
MARRREPSPESQFVLLIASIVLVVVLIDVLGVRLW